MAPAPRPRRRFTRGVSTSSAAHRSASRRVDGLSGRHTGAAGWWTPATGSPASAQPPASRRAAGPGCVAKATRWSPCSHAPPRLRGADDALLTALARDAAARVLVEDGACVRVNLVALAAEPLALHAASCKASRAPVGTARRVCSRRRGVAVSGARPSRRGRASPAPPWNFPRARGSYLVGPGYATPGPLLRNTGSTASRVPGELAVPEAGMRLEARLCRQSGRRCAAAARAAVAGAAGPVSRPCRPGLATGRPDASSGGFGPKEGTGPVRRPEGARGRSGTWCPSSPPPTGGLSGWLGTPWRGASASPTPQSPW